MCIRICIFNFKKQQQYKQKTQESKKKKEKRKINKRNKRRKETTPGKLTKKNYGHPGEDFSRHPHFRKQEFFFLHVKVFIN